MSAPHLPPKSCSVPAYYVRQSLPWIFVVVLIALLAGIAAALAALAWAVPGIVPLSDSRTIRGGIKQQNVLTPDTVLVKTVTQRTVTFFDKTKKRSGLAYTHDAVVGSGVVLSADGWIVAFVPTYQAGAELQWEIIDFQGRVYAVEQILVDPVVGLVYVRIAADGLPIISFAQAESDAVGSLLWARSYQQWQQVTILHSQKPAVASWKIWQPTVRFGIDPDVPVGSLLFHQQGAQGALVGFVDGNGTVLPVSFVQRQLGSLLQQQELRYTVASWEGTIVDGYFAQGIYISRQAFLITKDAGGTLKTGDLVLEIDGKLVESERLAEMVVDAPPVMRAVVLRSGKEETVEVQKTKLETGLRPDLISR